jgi:hypothetical protein
MASTTVVVSAAGTAAANYEGAECAARVMPVSPIRTRAKKRRLASQLTSTEFDVIPQVDGTYDSPPPATPVTPEVPGTPVTPSTIFVSAALTLEQFSENSAVGTRRVLAITYVPDPQPPPPREPPPPPPWSANLPTGERYVICKDCLYFSHDVSFYHCITCHGKARGRVYTPYVACDSDGDEEDDFSNSDDYNSEY